MDQVPHYLFSSSLPAWRLRTFPLHTFLYAVDVAVANFPRPPASASAAVAMESSSDATTAPTESLEQVQARHRRELKDLQGRITGKKKNATKKTRKGVNDECARMESELREVHAREIAALSGGGADENDDGDEGEDGHVNGGVHLSDKADGKMAQLAAETGKLSLSNQLVVPVLQQQQQPQNGQQQQQKKPSANGKKRNRQKERLARRAAEQEALAAKAETETVTMTDHRAVEGENMRKLFKTHGLVERDIAPDGHCLFAAVADQLAANDMPLLARSEDGEPAYKAVRRAAAAYMLEHGNDFAPFLEEDLEGYAGKMRDTAEWGGQLELTALSRVYGAEIRVVQDGRMERIGEEEGQESGKTLWLAYYRHGYGLGEHYNSLRKSP